jgi:hypothetical protein
MYCSFNRSAVANAPVDHQEKLTNDASGLELLGSFLWRQRCHSDFEKVPHLPRIS